MEKNLFDNYNDAKSKLQFVNLLEEELKMINTFFTTVKALLFTGLILITAIAVNAGDNKSKGKDIILDKPSTMYTPSYRNEYKI